MLVCFFVKKHLKLNKHKWEERKKETIYEFNKLVCYIKNKFHFKFTARSGILKLAAACSCI